MFSLTQKMVELTWSSEHPCDTQASMQKQQHRLAAGESNLLLAQSFTLTASHSVTHGTVSPAFLWAMLITLEKVTTCVRANE